MGGFRIIVAVQFWGCGKGFFDLPVILTLTLGNTRHLPVQGCSGLVEQKHGTASSGCGRCLLGVGFRASAWFIWSCNSATDSHSPSSSFLVADQPRQLKEQLNFFLRLTSSAGGSRNVGCGI